jgi:hypothetical protein
LVDHTRSPEKEPHGQGTLQRRHTIAFDRLGVGPPVILDHPNSGLLALVGGEVAKQRGRDHRVGGRGSVACRRCQATPTSPNRSATGTNSSIAWTVRRSSSSKIQASLSSVARP